MTGMTRWQLVLYSSGMTLMVIGVAWGLYRSLIVRACPTGQFNDLTLIVAGLGFTLLALRPFDYRIRVASVPLVKPPAYLVPLLRRNPRLAAAVWTMSIIGVALAAYSQWAQWSRLVWIITVIPAALYICFGIEAGKPAVGAAPGPPRSGGRASLPAIEGQGPGAKVQGEETGNREQGTEIPGKEESRPETAALQEQQEPRDA